MRTTNRARECVRGVGAVQLFDSALEPYSRVVWIVVRVAASLAGTLPDLPVTLRQNAKERVVALRAIGIRSRLDVHAVRVQVRRV